MTCHISVDGVWSGWSVEGPCAPSTGLAPRTRACDDPEPQFGGLPCPGPGTEDVPCLVDGLWSAWVESGCVAETGVNTKTRACDDPTPKNGGDPCSLGGTNYEEEACLGEKRLQFAGVFICDKPFTSTLRFAS